jgi:hypothetical protein
MYPSIQLLSQTANYSVRPANYLFFQTDEESGCIFVALQLPPIYQLLTVHHETEKYDFICLPFYNRQRK